MTCLVTITQSTDISEIDSIFSKDSSCNSGCLSGLPTLGISFFSKIVSLKILTPNIPVYYLEKVVSLDLC